MVSIPAYVIISAKEQFSFQVSVCNTREAYYFIHAPFPSQAADNRTPYLLVITALSGYYSLLSESGSGVGTQARSYLFVSHFPWLDRTSDGCSAAHVL